MQFLCLRFHRLVVKKILDPGPRECLTCHTWVHEKLAQHLIPGNNSVCVNDMPIEYNHVWCKLNHIPSPLGSSIHVLTLDWSKTSTIHQLHCLFMVGSGPQLSRFATGGILLAAQEEQVVYELRHVARLTWQLETRAPSFSLKLTFS